MYFRTSKTENADSYKLSICLKNSSFAVKSLQCTIVLDDGAQFVQDGDGYRIEKADILDNNWTVIARHKNGDQENSVTVLLYNTNSGYQIGTGNREVASMPLTFSSNDATNKIGAFIKDVTLTGADLKEYSGESYAFNFYTLTYYLDGAVYKTEELKAGDAIVPEQGLTKTGYSFSGWSEIPSQMPSNDVEVQGAFNINTYNLVYKLDGETYKSYVVEYGSAITAEANPVKEGYTFSGWSGVPDIMPANDVTVVGSFGVNTFNLIYKVDGVEYRRFALEYGSIITAESDPAKVGYTFSGWSEVPSTMPANDVEITGSFNPNSYNLVYVVDGDTCKSIMVSYGSAITAETDPVKTGYTFSGWIGLPDVMPANDVVVIGSFGINTYNIIYKVDSIEYRRFSYKYGSAVTIEPNPVKSGYSFSGWSEIPSYMPANDVVITGSFSINSYNLVYILDGITYKSSVVEYGASIIAENDPSKVGYTFSGWSEVPSTMPANDVEISGSFSINNYNLIYKVDGTIYKSLSVEYGSQIIAESNPVKSGYTFSGWSEIPSIMPANDVEITGSFGINSYALVYVLDGDTCKSLTLGYGSTITAEPDPVKTGYTFSGWSDIPSTMPANNVMVTGSFSINSYSLIYKIDGVVYKSSSLEYGTAIIAESEPLKTGYTFSGWSEIPSVMPANDVVITGSYNVNSYNLVYVLDGETYKSYVVDCGDSIIAELSPVKDGFTFSGWRGLPDIMPANDVTVIGSFGINTVSLVYKVDGKEYRRLSLEYGSTVTAEPIPVKEGYTFSGWSEIPATMPANDVEVTGTFSINSYKLVYLLDGDTCKSSVVEFGSAITAESNPVKTGYTFSGWSDIPSVMPANDVVVTGSFRINSYNLVYVINGDTCKSISLAYGSTIVAESNPSKEGYTFSGWSEIPATMPANDVLVTGEYHINTYNLVYMLDGETYKSYVTAYGSTITPETNPVKEGYTFSGWGDVPVTMPANDVVLSGTLSINAYKLIYKLNGTVYKTSSIEYGTILTVEPDPSKDGYTFSGWSDIPSTMPANDVEITGTFNINSYNLVYKLDGETYKSSVVVYGTALTAEADPVKTGYTFSGWSGLPDVMPASDVTVCGSFDINSYCIIYQIDSIEYRRYSMNYGSSIKQEPDPLKIGYTFSGWSEIPAIMPANDIVVTGTFSINSYKLIYILDGDTCKSSTVEYGSILIAETVADKLGYTFSGWNGLPDVMPANDVTVTGSYGLNSYNLIYRVDSMEYRRLSVKYGSVLTAEPDPAKVGYTFSGWSEIPATMPANDVIVTGSFKINSYNLVYKLDGDTCKLQSVEYGTAITAEADPVKTGYTFSGWSEIPDTMPANDVVVIGTFSINSYNLVYKIDGEIYTSSIVEYGSAIIAEADPSKVGYTFSGWSEIPESMPANDVLVTGSFLINSYNLIYVVDGDTCKTLKVEFGSTITAEADPVKVGYTFSGWSDIPTTMPACDVIVTGTFSINSYNLTYKVDGGVYKTSVVVYGSAITAIADPVKVGYTFSGWSEIPATMPANDVVIEGTFVINKYLLTVIVDDKVVFSDSITYGTRLADYIDLLIEKGIDFSEWEWYGDIETITMPAHDVTINASLFTSVQPVIMDADTDVIYDLTGKRIMVDDSTILPPGVYIRNGRKMIVR